MRSLYFRASIMIAQLYRFGIIYVKCILLSGVLILGAYLSMADPQTETFGSFLKFVQGEWLTLAVAAAIPLSFAYLLISAGWRGMQESNSCGGK